MVLGEGRVVYPRGYFVTDHVNLTPAAGGGLSDFVSTYILLLLFLITRKQHMQRGCECITDG